ncbi:hypothetical protein C8Q77DRAFT_1213225 [Trametes polyzona]|nr:hypothetical protein C8Q77DRAFT_1213225 [Trametes polyzona]
MAKVFNRLSINTTPRAVSIDRYPQATKWVPELLDLTRSHCLRILFTRSAAQLGWESQSVWESVCDKMFTDAYGTGRPSDLSSSPAVGLMEDRLAPFQEPLFSTRALPLGSQGNSGPTAVVSPNGEDASADILEVYTTLHLGKLEASGVYADGQGDNPVRPSGHSRSSTANEAAESIKDFLPPVVPYQGVGQSQGATPATVRVRALEGGSEERVATKCVRRCKLPAADAFNCYFRHTDRRLESSV